MKNLWITAVVISIASGALWAAEKPKKGEPMLRSTTIGESALISPGRYVVTVTPNFNGDMADRLKEAITHIPGIDDAETKTQDSTVTFTVNDGAQVRLADIQNVVAKIHNRAVVSAPVLEGTLTPKPGI